jgi:CubicO group peptidase (beta-lactamase class C family)
VGYDLAALIVERVSGVRFEEFLRRESPDRATAP